MMNIRTGKTYAWRALRALALILPLLGLGGCAALTQEFNSAPAATPGSQAYEEGLRAYENGDYRKAAMLFDGLTQRGFDMDLRRKALYSLACTRLITARNPEEFRKAQETWSQWEAYSQPTAKFEDPRLMAPLLLYMRPPYEPIQDCSPKDTNATLDAEPAKTAPKYPERSKHKPVDMQEQSCYKQTRSLEREINRLKSQIKALESLDQHIQERKREISVP